MKDVIGKKKGPSERSKLWYRQPATRWMEALPIGNGSLGAMVYGDPFTEHLQLNNDTFYSGAPYDRTNPDSLVKLPQVRDLIFNKKYAAADKLIESFTQKEPYRLQCYQPLGDFYIHFDRKGHSDRTIENYHRELDMETGQVLINYSTLNITYTHRTVASYPDKAIVYNIEASEKASLNLIANLDHEFFKETAEANSEGLLLTGKWKNIPAKHSNCFCNWNENGLRFRIQVRVRIRDGTISSEGDQLHIKDATGVDFILTAATDFNGQDPAQECTNILKSLSRKEIDVIIKDHITDHSVMMNRVKLDLPDPGNLPGKFSTMERLKRVKGGNEDLLLIQQYFQYGRYLLMASSRPGSQPANLQGIWNKDIVPSWGSKYTININIEMNYWVAEVCNLSECHDPLFYLIDEMVESGRKTARINYGCRGWCAHHNTDLWRDTVPVDGNAQHAMCPMSGAWLCQHLWFRFEFTRDKEFLQSKYPVMKEAAVFFVDFLVEDNQGYLVTCPSTSPENKFFAGRSFNIFKSICASSMASTMDMALIRDLFSHCIEASNILGIDEEFRGRLEKMLHKLYPYKIGRHGQLQEWYKDFREPQPGHRHMSHLLGFYPGDQITLRGTPELASGVKKSILRRLKYGGGGTGWSRAWLISLWARLEDGDRANECISVLLRKSTETNLFDLHPPHVFQIDGNFGATAGIAEMLLQSHGNEINLLPALPKSWKGGKIRGLKARGNYVVDIQWDKGSLKNAKITSKLDDRVTLRTKRLVLIKCGENVILLDRLEPNLVQFHAEAGKTYEICPI